MTIHNCTAGWVGMGLLLSVCRPASGLEVLDGFQVHGFASQSYFLTSDNNLFGDSDEEEGSLDFTETGLNVSWVPLPALQIAAQGLFRRAGEGHEHDFELDYGLVDYSVIATVNGQFGLRLGRIKNPLGLYNDTRDVAFTRPSILLPQSIYFDRTRKFALSADGAQLYGGYQSAWGNWTAQVGPVFPQVGDRDTELALFGGRDLPGELDNDLSLIGRLTYEISGLRLALTAVDANIDYDPAVPPPGDLAAGEIEFQPWIFSAQYSTEDWTFTGEYAERRFEFQGFGPGIPDQEFDGESYYIQAAYRFHPKWELMARYDALFTDRNDRDGLKFKARTGAPANTRFGKDWTVGMRFDLTPSIMLRAEYHHVNGTAWLPVQDNPDLTALTREWDLYALLVAFRF
ncbi:MAG: hypothetical protein ACREXW_16325 [Gammaproteobacteria bacterium]